MATIVRDNKGNLRYSYEIDSNGTKIVRNKNGTYIGYINKQGHTFGIKGTLLTFQEDVSSIIEEAERVLGK